MNITTLGIDLAKNIFQLHGVDTEGKVILKKRLPRSELTEFIAQLPACLIGLEACGSSHYWARKFQSFGHTVKLMSPSFVKAYVKSNKNDKNDSEAICEAVSRPNMRFVQIKKQHQQDMQCLHRIRSQFIKNRTALVNQIRGLLAEYGITFSKEINNVKKSLPNIIDDKDNILSDYARELFKELNEDFFKLNNRIKIYDQKVVDLAKNNKDCKRLEKIPGIGVLCATALCASISDPHLFKNGRELAAWLGLVPRQASSGNKQRLLSISKRGDKYLRSLLIHGARAVIYRAKDLENPVHKWVINLKQRKGVNKAAVALANKNARVAWALLAKQADYKVVMNN
jgi:transposase